MILDVSPSQATRHELFARDMIRALGKYAAEQRELGNQLLTAKADDAIAGRVLVSDDRYEQAKHCYDLARAADSDAQKYKMTAAHWANVRAKMRAL